MSEMSMISFLVTDWGQYELPPSVAAKIADYPKVKMLNPLADEAGESEVIDFNHPALARYLRVVTRHMEKRFA